MHSLDVELDVGDDVHEARRIGVNVAWLEAVPRRWSMFTQSAVVGKNSWRLNAA